MKQLKLTVSLRKERGSGACGRLRRDRKIPAVVYGRSGSEAITVDEINFRKMMREAKGAAALVEVVDDQGAQKLTVVQKVERDPVTDSFLHVDFHEVAPDEMMHASLPVQVKGESTGVKNENGILEVHIHTADVRCLPANLPEFIVVDVTELHVGEAICVKDLEKMEGVDYMGDPGVVVISCSEGKKVEAEDEEEASKEAEQPEEGKSEEEGKKEETAS